MCIITHEPSVTYMCCKYHCRFQPLHALSEATNVVGHGNQKFYTHSTDRDRHTHTHTHARTLEHMNTRTYIKHALNETLARLVNSYITSELLWTCRWRLSIHHKFTNPASSFSTLYMMSIQRSSLTEDLLTLQLHVVMYGSMRVLSYNGHSIMSVCLSSV